MTQIHFTAANGGSVHCPLNNLTPVPVRTHAKTLYSGDPTIVIEDGRRQFSMSVPSAERLAQSILATAGEIRSQEQD